MKTSLRRAVVTADSPASVDRLWKVVVDWPGHGRFFPFTRVHALDEPPGPGQRLEATTRLGPLRLTDTMQVTRWEPPGERGLVELVRVGGLLGGRAVLRVTPHGSGSRLEWSTDVGPAPARLRHAIAPVSTLASIPLYRHVVRAMAREAARD